MKTHGKSDNSWGLPNHGRKVFGIVGPVLLHILINGYASLRVRFQRRRPVAIQLQHRLPGGWRPNLGALIRCSLENGSSRTSATNLASTGELLSFRQTSARATANSSLLPAATPLTRGITSG